MQKSISVLFLLVALLGWSHSYSQQLSQKGKMDTIELYIQQADQLFEEGKYYAAANLYGKAIIEKRTPYILHQLATSNRKGRFYNFAELWYGELIDSFPNAYEFDLYWYGKMLKASGGQYKKARQVFQKFRDQQVPDRMKESEQYQQLKKAAQREMKACRFAIRANQTLSERNVFNIGNTINKKESEFGAVQRSPKTLLFSGAKTIPVHRVNKFLFITVNQYYDTLLLNRVYRSQKEQQRWQERSSIYLPLQDQSYDIGPPAFTPDHKKAYFTMCHGSYGKKRCHLYVSRTPSPGKWLRPRKLPPPINQSNNSSKNPTVAIHDGDTVLFFASDRKGGEGEFDIWYCKKDIEGDFLPPQNAGQVINTANDEVSPFYYPPDTLLYFSSDGHINFGEFDVFKTKGTVNQGWTEAKNIGPPVNGPTDDYYFSKFRNEDQIVAYFSSNRQGGFSKQGTCCDDIYFYREEAAPQKPSTGEDTLTARYIDSLPFQQILQKYGDLTHPSIRFKVQVGAFENPSSDMFSNLSDIAPLTKDTSSQGIVKFMLGQFTTLNKAAQLQQQIQERGVRKAWIVNYYKAQRISLFTAIQKLVEAREN